MNPLLPLARRLAARIQRRPPDFVIGGADRPYLLRWFVIPRNRFLNVYLHEFRRDDDDRALHDHPWFWCSLILDGGYIEHTIAAGGVHRRRERSAGSVAVATPWKAHRVELFTCGLGNPRPCMTLFITGPRLRSWGFHCPDQGWIHWRRFTDPTDAGRVGPGCEG